MERIQCQFVIGLTPLLKDLKEDVQLIDSLLFDPFLLNELPYLKNQRWVFTILGHHLQLVLNEFQFLIENEFAWQKVADDVLLDAREIKDKLLPVAIHEVIGRARLKQDRLL